MATKSKVVTARTRIVQCTPQPQPQPQPPSPFLRLPVELRITIYHMAFPRIRKCQELRHCSSSGCLPTISPSKGSRSSRGHLLHRGICQDERPEEDSVIGYPYPGSLMMTCRQIYEEIAPLCDHYLCVPNFLLLKTMLSVTAPSRQPHDIYPHADPAVASKSHLLGRIRSLSIEYNVLVYELHGPDSESRVLSRWIEACATMAAGLADLQKLRLRLRIPSLADGQVLNGLHVLMLKELEVIFQGREVEVEVQMMLICWADAKATRLDDFSFETWRLIRQCDSQTELDQEYRPAGWKFKWIAKGVNPEQVLCCLEPESPPV